MKILLKNVGDRKFGTASGEILPGRSLQVDQELGLMLAGRYPTELQVEAPEMPVDESPAPPVVVAEETQPAMVEEEAPAAKPSSKKKSK